jgi:hypothetical protein
VRFSSHRDGHLLFALLFGVVSLLYATVGQANSAVGLVGVLFAGQLPSSHFGPYALTSLGGSVVGTAIGLRWLSQTSTRFILAGILLAAGIQLAFF